MARVESSGPGRVFRWATERAELILDPQTEVSPWRTQCSISRLNRTPTTRRSSIEIAVRRRRPYIAETPRPDASVWPCRSMARPIVRGGSNCVSATIPTIVPSSRPLSAGTPMLYRVCRRRASPCVRPGHFGICIRIRSLGECKPALGPGAETSRSPDGLQVVQRSTAVSYCVHYGPLRILARGAYRFDSQLDVLEGGMSIGVLTRGSAALDRLRQSSSIRIRHTVLGDSKSRSICPRTRHLAADLERPSRRATGFRGSSFTEGQAIRKPRGTLMGNGGRSRRAADVDARHDLLREAGAPSRRRSHVHRANRLGALSRLADTMARASRRAWDLACAIASLRASPEFQDIRAGPACGRRTAATAARSGQPVGLAQVPSRPASRQPARERLRTTFS